MENSNIKVHVKHCVSQDGGLGFFGGRERNYMSKAVSEALSEKSNQLLAFSQDKLSEHESTIIKLHYKGLVTSSL